MNSIDLFATKFFEFFIDRVDVYNIINDILRNKEQIKIISSTTQQQSDEVYKTDYFDPIKIDSFDFAIEKVNKEFRKFNMNYQIHNYWTAIYNDSGFHGMHNHLETSVDQHNYSGILYLSAIGHTTFFSNAPSSFHKKATINSDIGKVIFFPSDLPHCYEPVNSSNNERYIIAFNGSLKNV